MTPRRKHSWQEESLKSCALGLFQKYLYCLFSVLCFDLNKQVRNSIGISWFVLKYIYVYRKQNSICFFISASHDNILQYVICVYIVRIKFIVLENWTKCLQENCLLNQENAKPWSSHLNKGYYKLGKDLVSDLRTTQCRASAKH